MNLNRSMQGVWHTNLQITDQYTKTRWIFLENKIDPKKFQRLLLLWKESRSSSSSTP